MTDPDFSHLTKTLTALWPKMELTVEWLHVWRTSLDAWPWEHCQAAIRDHATYSKFAPKPSEIANRLRLRHLGRDSDIQQSSQDIDQLFIGEHHPFAYWCHELKNITGQDPRQGAIDLSYSELIDLLESQGHEVQPE